MFTQDNDPERESERESIGWIFQRLLLPFAILQNKQKALLRVLLSE